MRAQFLMSQPLTLPMAVTMHIIIVDHIRPGDLMQTRPPRLPTGSNYGLARNPPGNPSALTRAGAKLTSSANRYQNTTPGFVPNAIVSRKP